MDEIRLTGLRANGYHGGFEHERRTGQVFVVGDEPIYAKSGFRRIPKGQVKMPGPVDPARLLVAELAAGAFDGVSGLIRPDWEIA